MKRGRYVGGVGAGVSEQMVEAVKEVDMYNKNPGCESAEYQD